MNKQTVLKLYDAADICAENFSRTDRAHNHNQETFTVKHVKVLSEHVAVVYFEKAPTGKIAMAVFYYLPGMQDGVWRYFFPTDSHVLGLAKLAPCLEKVEEKNLPANFQ